MQHRRWFRIAVLMIVATSCSSGDADSNPDYWADAGTGGSGGGSTGGLCAPCTSSDQCGGSNDHCLANQAGESFCGQSCSGSCPAGFDCVSIQGSVMQCVPSSGSCQGAGGSGGATNTGGSGGSSGTGGGTAGSGGSTSGTCSVELEGATGNEPGGMIPVCCAPTAAEKQQIDAVFALVNEHRAANGVAALAYDTKLEATIQGHCIHMVQHPFFDHKAPETAIKDFWTRAGMCGTSANAENIAAGQNSPDSVMASWKSSSGHNANMLNPKYTRIGIGRHGSYWGQIFGQ